MIGRVALAVCLLAGKVGAMTYHIDAQSGTDASDGKTPATAWKTIAKANQAALAAGDAILFRGGQVHAGSLRLTTGANLTVASYGEGRATIDAGTGTGLEAAGIRGVTIRNLVIKGVGRKSGNDRGSGVWVHDASQVVVRDVEAHGFQRAGISVRNSDGVRIEDSHAHDNGFAGILVNGTNMKVLRCRAINNPGDPTVTNNHSGNGILVTGADILVEECESAGNGWDQTRGKHGNGPVGIWCHDAERVTIRRCIAHHNKSTAGDGGGFDFDGGTRDSVIEYCYSYENQGPGYLVWEYGSEHPIKGNVIRYNVSVNDRHAGIHIGKSGGADVQDLQVYHNTVIASRGPAVMISGAWVNDKFVPEAGLKNVYLRNNILVGPKDGKIVDGPGGATFENNLYWSSGGQPAEVSFDKKALVADPKLFDAKLIPQLTDPAKLADLFAFALTADSPAIDRGLDLKKLFKLDPGGKDIFGNPAPQGRAPDLGAHELK